MFPPIYSVDPPLTLEMSAFESIYGRQFTLSAQFLDQSKFLCFKASANYFRQSIESRLFTYKLLSVSFYA